MMGKKKFSESLSWYGWQFASWVRGRKKLMITLVGVVLTGLALDPGLVELLAGGAVFEGMWALGEFYFKKVKLD